MECWADWRVRISSLCWIKRIALANKSTSGIISACTFNTPWGRYRFKRLPLGIKSAMQHKCDFWRHSRGSHHSWWPDHRCPHRVRALWDKTEGGLSKRASNSEKKNIVQGQSELHGTRHRRGCQYRYGYIQSQSHHWDSTTQWQSRSTVNAVYDKVSSAINPRKGHHHSAPQSDSCYKRTVCGNSTKSMMM